MRQGSQPRAFCYFYRDGTTNLIPTKPQRVQFRYLTYCGSDLTNNVVIAYRFRYLKCFMLPISRGMEPLIDLV